MKVALTGATGNMGRETLKELLKIDEIDSIKILVHEDGRFSNIKDVVRKNKNRIQIINGNIKNKYVTDRLVRDVSYVLHLGAVIPPRSDKHPDWAVDCNVIGVKNLLASIEEIDEKYQPKLVHISTLALYGNRNYKHPWAQIGDPLMPSPFDIYSAAKLRGEFAVLESNVKNWVVIRQTAMLHRNMLKDNISDGLMFHTCFNSPLEWATAEDSGLLMANIIKEDMTKDLSKTFWKRAFNLGSVKENRIMGSTTLNDGFALMGAGLKDMFKPNYNAIRNFHGVWFYDSEKLEELFHYQRQSCTDYWKQIYNTHKYYSLGRIVPKSWISKLVIQKLFKDDNSIKYWYKHDDEARLIAYFGSKARYEQVPNNWQTFYLTEEGKDELGCDLDYASLRNISTANLIDYGFDKTKPIEEIDYNDLVNIATMHGGKLLSKSYTKGDLYTKLEWETQDGEKFIATAFTVAVAGHWYCITYTQNAWDFDRLSKKDKIYAQVWYDSHYKDEDYFYWYDDEYKANYRKVH